MLLASLRTIFNDGPRRPIPERCRCACRRRVAGPFVHGCAIRRRPL